MKPYVPSRPCTHPGCGVAVRGGGPCTKHAADKQVYTHTTDGRDRAIVRRTYGTAQWKRIREAILDAHPSCARCEAKASVVHHVVPFADGGTHSLANLQPLCASCHQRAHREYERGRAIVIFDTP